MEDSYSVSSSSFSQQEAGKKSAGASGKVDFKTEREFDIPRSYGDNKVVLMVRDPWTIFTYWEINNSLRNSVEHEIRAKGLTASRTILRVYDVTGNDPYQSPKIVHDYELQGQDSWYFHGSPDAEWMVEIGILCSNGEFFCLIRSNVVKTPSNRMSDITDQDWMCSEELFYKMFAVSGGYDVGKSSLELRELIERHLRKWFSSGGVISQMFGSASWFLGRK
ncbi:MAG: DUF4912 domain-containing protein [Candidatus Omnitrophota bacterium]